MGDLASTIALAGTGGATMRIGTVRTYDGVDITVDVGRGALVAMPYARSYQPLLGDFVTCLNQGSAWFCTGAAAGSPSDNVLVNPSFEGDTVGNAPANWGRYHDPGSSQTATFTVATSIQIAPVNGSKCLSLYLNNLTSTSTKQSLDYVYSDPFAVAPGQTWVAAAWSRFSSEPASGGISALCNAGALIYWLANQSDVPPTALATTTFSQVSYSGSAPFWGLLTASGGSTGSVVPAGANWGRVVLFTLIEATYQSSSCAGRAQWDSVICRRVG